MPPMPGSPPSHEAGRPQGRSLSSVRREGSSFDPVVSQPESIKAASEKITAAKSFITLKNSYAPAEDAEAADAPAEA